MKVVSTGPDDDVSLARVLLAPRMIAAHLVGIIAVGVAFGAGVWQYAAWGERRAAEARDLTTAAPAPLLDLMGGDDPFPGDQVGRPVSFSGQWRAEETFLVEREDDGWWVVTPVAVDGTDSAIPVVRGWADDPRDPAPEQVADSTAVDVVGWLQPSESGGRADLDLADDVLPELRIASLTQRVDMDLFSGYAVARTIDDEPPALRAVTPTSIPDVGVFTALRNLLYAAEWWVFAAFAAFIWWRFTRDEWQAAQEAGEPTPEERSVDSEP